MIDDRDVWRAAVLMVKRYGDDALLEAAERADHGDLQGFSRREGIRPVLVRWLIGTAAN